MTRHTLGQSFGCASIVHIPDDKRVEADQRIVSQSDIGLGRARLLARPGKTVQETVERFLYTIEPLQEMSSPELTDFQQHRHLRPVRRASGREKVCQYV